MSRPRRIFLIIGLVFLLGYLVFGLSRIRFDVDIVRLLPEGLKESESLRLFLEHFAREGELIVTVYSEEPEAVEKAAPSLADAFREESELVASVRNDVPWQTEDIEEPEIEGGQESESSDSPKIGDDELRQSGQEMLELLAWVLANQPTEELVKLEQSLSPERIGAKLEESLERLSDDLASEETAMIGFDPLRFLHGNLDDMRRRMGNSSNFVSDDGQLRIIFVDSIDPKGSYRDKIAWIESMWEVVHGWERTWEQDGNQEVKIGFTGSPAFVAEVSSGMEGDMQFSGTCTLLLISLIFWVAYRRVRPLVDLVLALMSVFLLTLATGGILFEELSAISIGFASILIGLTVDYAVILYQKARSTGCSVSQLREMAGRGIFWASLTTAAAFTSLAAGNIPGLSELGVLVGAGVLIGAMVMLGGFVHRAEKAGKREAARTELDGKSGKRPGSGIPSGHLENGATYLIALLLLALLGVFIFSGPPALDGSTRALRPKESKAQETYDFWASKFARTRGWSRVIIEGKDLEEAGRVMREAKLEMEKMVEDGVLEQFSLPFNYWPEAEVQQANLNGPCARLVADRERLRKSVDEAGFKEIAFNLADTILDYWEKWASSEQYPVWPGGGEANRVLSRLIVRELPGEGKGRAAESGGVWALGSVKPAYREGAPAGENDDLLREVRRRLDLDGVYMGGGRVLGMALAEVVPRSILSIFIMLSVLVLIALALAFRRAGEVILTLVCVAVTIGAMFGAMKLLGITWNFMNLAALLLALGAGLDYCIHILIELRRNGGDVISVRRGVGRALLICGLSSVAGFGSLAWAGNFGLASLGQTCAIALAINTLVAVFLLPKVWARFCKS